MADAAVEQKISGQRLVDDANGRSERLELGGQGEAGRPGPDDQDVEQIAVGRCHVRAARVARQRWAARPASVTRVRLALAATMTGAHRYDPGLVSAWPVMMPSRVRSATTAARAATAAAVGGRVARSTTRPSRRPNRPVAATVRPRAGPATAKARPTSGSASHGPISWWRHGGRALTSDRGDPGQPDQRPGDQQAQRDPTRLDRAELRPERGGDRVRVAELGDRRRGRLLR